MSSSPARANRPPAPVRQGSIQSNTIPYLIHGLAAGRATGVLTVEEGEVRKTLQFHEGRLLFAASNQRDDRLSSFLMREGVLPLKSLMKALEVMMATKERLGEILVQWKMLGAEDVEKFVRIQVREIAYSIFHWQRGHFSFEAKELPRERITAGDDGDRVVLEGVKRITSWVRAYEELGGLHAELLTAKDAPTIAPRLGLNPAEQKILDLCDQPMTLEEICEDSRLKDLEVCKVVWAFLIVGALMKA